MSSKAENDETTPAERVVPKGYWEDGQGNLVPESKVKDLDKLRDGVAKRLANAAKDMSDQLFRFKLLAMAELAQFIEMSASQYGAEVRGAKGKGNVTITSFDGRFKVERAIAEFLVFDERLQVAKSLIDQCVHRWGKGANKNLLALVNHAFQVDKAGNVSTTRVLSLRTFDVDDEEWKRAMEAIADSMRTAGTKSYLRFYERNDATGEYLPISLNVAAV